jgi:TolB protein
MIVKKIFMILIIIIISCKSSDDVTFTDPISKEGAAISIQFPKPSSISNLVVYAKLIISSNDIDTIRAELTVNDTSVFGIIENIPPGKERKFTINCYNEEMVLTYSGEQTIYIVAGQTHTLEIVLYPMNPNGLVIIMGTFSPFPKNDGLIVFQADYSGSSDVYIMNPYASNIMQLTNSSGHDLYPQISPLKDKIVFCRLENGVARPFQMDLDGKNLKQLNILPGASIGFCGWSPDAKKLVLHANKDGDTDIFIYDFSSNVTTQIVFNNSTDWIPNWSPDGNKIVFYSNMQGTYRLFKVDPNGENLELVTNTQNTEERVPKYSPDGTQIVMMGRHLSSWDIYTVSSDGSDFFEVTSTDGFDEEIACWSPDGNKILFHRSGGNSKGYGLYQISPNGGSLFELLDTEFNEWNAHWR